MSPLTVDPVPKPCCHACGPKHFCHSGRGVSEMTCNVPSGTLYASILLPIVYTIPGCLLTRCYLPSSISQGFVQLDGVPSECCCWWRGLHSDVTREYRALTDSGELKSTGTAGMAFGPTRRSRPTRL